MPLIQKVQGTIPGKTADPRRGPSRMRRFGELVATGAAGAVGAGLMAGVRMAQEQVGFRFDPAPSYLFFVELSGLLVAFFTECSGLKVERKMEEIKEGGLNDYVHKLPGRLEYKNIVLKRGLSMSRALWDWFMQGRHDCNVKRLNFSIIQGAPGQNLATAIAGGTMGMAEMAFGMLGKGFGKVKHWDVENAWPVKWEMSALKASDSKTVAIETLEIAHHGLSLSYEVGTPMSPAQSAAASGYVEVTSGPEEGWDAVGSEPPS
jgi:phage tail-like protein